MMTRNPATCRRDSSLKEAASLMREHDCGAIPVVENGKPVGIVTDRDIAIRVVAEGKNPADRSVGDIMSSPVITAHPTDGAETLLRKMQREQVRRVVIVDDGGSCVGIVAQADIALALDEARTGEAVAEISESDGTGRR
jgi:CBS domain-containing protein